MTAPEGAEASELLYPKGYLLKQLSVYNWGPFQGRHQISIDDQGTAIIGATGSGKTTLVDALMTLICANPKYNLASTGGHESDRDLVSYIRGKAGEGNAVDEKHISRTGKTETGIEAVFSNGEQQISLAGLFWIDSNSSATTDLKRRWIFYQGDEYRLDDWLSVLHEQDARALKQLAKETPGLTINDSKKAYLSRVVGFFEVGDNAFTLLNRAAGMKQLNSIDELFRELVLDDNAKFERAAEVVAGFDTLTGIHNELQTARDQRDSLLPVKDEYEKFIALQEQTDIQNQLQEATPVWFAQHAYQIWSAEYAAVKQQAFAKQQELDLQKQSIEQAQQEVDAHHSTYLNLGGGDIKLLEANLETAKEKLEAISQRQQWYLTQVRNNDLSSELSAQSFSQNQSTAQDKLKQAQQTFDAQNQAFVEAQTNHVNLRRTQNELAQQINAAKQRPNSSVPPKFDDFRQLLAQAIQTDSSQLPFVAELVEVKNEQSQWRGAIERAIGSHRLRILVPKAVMQHALTWVNQRHNKLHVRLLEVNENYKAVDFMTDGFTRKLNFKPHPHREAVKHLLADIDRHCVDSAETLHETPHGMTKEGLMSGKRGFFEKQDQKRLDQDWMTGFNNRDLLNNLQTQQQELEVEIEQAKTAETHEAAELAQLGKHCEALKELSTLSFAQIDTENPSKVVDNLEDRLNQLRAPDSDAAKAEQAWNDAKSTLTTLNNAASALTAEAAVLNNQSKQAHEAKQQALNKIGDGLDDTQLSLCQDHFDVPNSEQKTQLNELETSAVKQIQTTLKKLNNSTRTCSNDLIRFLGKAKAKDTGALSESGTGLIDIPDYLQRLEVLIEEALPEKITQFQDYLNKSSDQTVEQVLHEVENEVLRFEERIEDLNNTMLQVDFQPGHFLRLNATHIEHDSLKKLRTAQNHLRSARMADDEGESHYKALRNVVVLLQEAAENKKRVGSRALLDPRYRLTFNVSVIDRSDFHEVEKRSGSQSGSGGEKEVITSYILTASLSYALCPEGARKPLFSTIVLDEAFSKTSQKAASSIISALRQFGLHPLFVTPNKEMALLRTHTRSAVLIHRKGMNATTTTWSWEELQKKAQKISNK